MHCNYAKEYLKEKGIPVESINVFEDKEALQQLINEGHSIMPVVDVDVLGTQGSSQIY